jgi:phosphopantothenoylcysteine synthetase/decarboxylase
MASKKDSINAQVFAGKKFLITSGPIRGPIDAVRFISSTSTGKLGSLLALEALRRGAQVTFVFGEGSAQPEPRELESSGENRFTARPVVTYDDVMKVFSQELSTQKHQVVIHAMAVLDYVPAKSQANKVPSGKHEWTLKLVPTPKLIQMVKRWNPHIYLVGFKLEAGADRQGLIQAAHRCAEESGADLVVANDLSTIRRGDHQAIIVNPQGKVETTLKGKEQIAHGLMDLIAAYLKGRK